MFILLLFLSLNFELSYASEPLDVCIKQDYHKTKCNYIEDDRYTPQESGLFINTVYDIYDYFTSLKVPLAQRNSLGQKIRTKMKDGLTKHIQKRSYSDCQKVCLVKCISSQYIEGCSRDADQDSLKAKNGSIVDIYEIGKGECTEFSLFADDLLQAIGIESRTHINHSSATHEDIMSFSAMNIRFSL